MSPPKKILLFEWLTSGGMWQTGDAPSHVCAMQNQGREMLLALAEDFLAGGLEVLLPVDSRLSASMSRQAQLKMIEIGEEECLPEVLINLASESDYVVVIAPESECILSNCLRWLKDFEDRILNPSPEFTELASNKQSVFEYLQSRGFQHSPCGINFGRFQRGGQQIDRFPLPAVLKPIQGAGSEEVVVIEDWDDLDLCLNLLPDQYWLESFVAGTPVSVSVLGSRCGYELLTPTIQRFDQRRRSEGLIGEYVGSEYPIDQVIKRRALKLAGNVVQALPPTLGYFGLDLVVGDSAGQTNAFLIEVNPRLTSSYLSLREIYSENLAMLMLEKTLGPFRQAPERQVKTCTFRSPSL